MLSSDADMELTRTRGNAAHRWRAVLLTAVVLTCTSACFWPFKRGAPGPQQLRVQLSGSVDQNRDEAGRPHSVVVTVYQLSARTKFDAVTAAALLRSDAQALGEELVAKREVTLLPSGHDTLALTVPTTARFVAVTADFIIREGNAWRQVAPLDARKKQLRIAVRGRQLAIQ